MSNINLKKWIIPNIPYLLFVYLFGKVAQAIRLAPGLDARARIGTGHHKSGHHGHHLGKLRQNRAPQIKRIKP